MHGRLKVRTTAEQEEAKRKEREKKLKIFTAGTERVFEKRKNLEFDKEGLDVSGKLLDANPDFYSLWNYRRQCFQHLKETESEESLQECCDAELEFLQSCLRTNPKSYGTWHHRCWIMDLIPKPDWQKELKLCNRCLELDERNFHCWDYRRFVVQRASVSLEEEFKYTTDKINTNFSNFSSWHYRSKLIPIIHPHPYHTTGIDNDVLLKEYELTQNAFFTDPNDQSAWFYHRWLLGKGQNRLNIRLLYVTRRSGKPMVIVSLTKVVKVTKDCQLHLKINSEKIEGEWKTPDNNDFGRVWVCNIDGNLLQNDDDHNVQVALKSQDSVKTIDKWSCVLEKNKSDAKHTSNFKPGALFRSEFSDCASSVLQEQLEQCQQLHELEPDNKWVMLTIIALTRALDPMKYAEETYSYLKKLKDVDPMRAHYYEDLKSKYVIENIIEASLEKKSDEICLKGKELTALYHTEHFVIVKSLDMSENKLINLKGCEMLQCAQSISADDNNISDCQGLSGLCSLEELSIRNNNLTDVNNLSPLSSCKSLRILHVHGNPIASDPLHIDQIKKILPHLNVID